MSSERTVHVPVMVHEVLEQLALSTGLTILDGTIGGGGHSRKILEHMPSGCRLIGMDRDPAMLARAGQVLGGENVHLAQGSYAELDRVLDELRIPAVDRVLLDLGLSSDQLADPQRGFGFSTAGDLDMRFDQSTGSPAAELLASAEEEELTRIFTEYGDEPQAGRIARQIVEQRRHQPLRTAAELRTLIESLPASRGQTHPATRVFQALRIAVNQELDQLQSFLDDVLPRRLSAGGRAVILTFHSLEDRLVKDAFRSNSRWEVLTRKPLTATPSEVRWNPRARSAKLRAAVRLESVT